MDDFSVFIKTKTFKSKEEFIHEFSKYSETHAEQFFIQLLKELKNSVVLGNCDSFEYFCKLISYIICSKSKETLRVYYNNVNNPIKNTNVVILACKNSRFGILDYLFKNGNKFVNDLSFNIGESAILPISEDDECHNAFYYCIRSGDVDNLKTLIYKWPDDYFSNQPEKLDEILSKTYEELILKNIQLPDDMKIFVENTLINTRFFSDNDGKKSDKITLTVVKERIEIVLKNIKCLIEEYSVADVDVDEKCLLLIKLIAQDIHVLKRQIKSTYDRLPWEEIEFCLISFISMEVNTEEINLIYLSVLTKNKLLEHLKNFSQSLEKVVLQQKDVNSKLPTLKREEVIENISHKFGELYEDFRTMRDIYSLEKIAGNIDVALNVKPEDENSRLVILRVLQVTGEYLKNTLESPNISNEIKDVLLSSRLQSNTLDVLKSFRNIISHFNTLEKRIEVENNDDINFLTIQNDLKKIKIEIANLREKSKAKAIRTFLKRLVKNEDFKAVKKLSNMIFKLIPHLKQINPYTNINSTTEFQTIINLINELENEISDQTFFENNLLSKIKNIIQTEGMKLLDVHLHFFQQFRNMVKLTGYATQIESNIVANTLKFSIAEDMDYEEEEYEKIKEIPDLFLKLRDSVNQRKHSTECKKINTIITEIVQIISLDIGKIEGINVLKNEISFQEKKELQSAEPKTENKEKANYYLNQRLKALKNILNENQLLNELNICTKIHCYKKNKKLQLLVEMLLLDIYETLQYLGCLKNNLLFLDKYYPLLIGKSLRNHLAHGNTIINVLQLDISVTIMSNVLNLINNDEKLTSMKIGEYGLNDTIHLKDRNDCYLNIITTKQELFDAAKEGDITKINECVKRGADLKSTDGRQWTLLHYSAAGGSLEATRFLLQRGLDININNIQNQKPLHIASLNGHENIIKFLIEEKHVIVDDIGEENQTSLHIAAKNGHTKIVKFLLKNKSNVEIMDINEKLPFHCAAENGHQEIVNLLLTRNKKTLHATCFGRWTALHLAAFNGHEATVKTLLAKKASVNARTSQGDTPLNCAAQQGHLEVTKILLKAGANVNNVAVDDVTPLYSAICRGNENIVQELLLYKANIYILKKNNIYMLHNAVEKGHLKIVNILLKNKAEVNEKNDNNWTPLHMAADDGHLDIVNTLIAHGANVLARTNLGNTALHLAANQGSIEIVKILLKLIDVNTKSSTGTALHRATEIGHLGIVKLLITSGANVNATDNDRWTPLRIAAQWGHADIVKLLLASNANVNVRDKHNGSPLILAVQQGHSEIAKTLIAANADVNFVGEDNATALHLAACNGLKNIVETLLDNGACINVQRNGWSALSLALSNGHVDCANILMHRGAVIQREFTFRFLYGAIKSGYIEVLELLLNIDKEVVNHIHRGEGGTMIQFGHFI